MAPVTYKALSHNTTRLFNGHFNEEAATAVNMLKRLRKVEISVYEILTSKSVVIKEEYNAYILI